MTKIISTGYEVVFEGERFSYLEKFLASTVYSKYFILTDNKAGAYCLPKLLKKAPALKQAEVLAIASGEENKTIETCVNLWNELTESGADRKSLLVNLGGGVISDMGGFVAATFKRGIEFINIPTTLLSMADASVGGKTGIDFGVHKNHIGTFTQPKGVFVYTPFLKTLEQRQLINGLAEIIKAALIADKKLWEKLVHVRLKNYKQLNELIYLSVQIKNNIVKKDPEEKNIRKALNFGHTIGHAIEGFYLGKKGKELLHGEAIAIGMIAEAYISYKKKGINANELSSIVQLIAQYFPKVNMNKKDFLSMLALMQHDKKNERGKVLFTLLKGIGKYNINIEVNSMEALEALTFYTSL